MISHYFGIFEAMYHWEENDSVVQFLEDYSIKHCVAVGKRHCQRPFV